MVGFAAVVVVADAAAAAENGGDTDAMGVGLAGSSNSDLDRRYGDTFFLLILCVLGAALVGTDPAEATGALSKVDN